MLRYLTEENLRAVIVGAGVGALATVAAERARARSGWLIGIVGAVLAFWLVGLTEAPPQLSSTRLQWALAVGAVAGLGHARLERRATDRWVATWVLLAACGSVWIGVPENRPTLVITGVIVGTVVAGGTGHPGTGFGHSLGVAWAVAQGYAASETRYLGALLALAPLAAVIAIGWVPPPRIARRAMPALIGIAAVSGLAAARWIGVAPDATTVRLVIVAAGTVAAVALISDR